MLLKEQRRNDIFNAIFCHTITYANHAFFFKDKITTIYASVNDCCIVSKTLSNHTITSRISHRETQK